MSPYDNPYRDNPYRNDTPVRPIARIEDVVTGLIVIAVGACFLAGNLGLHLPFALFDNWWALFILIGAVAPATRAVARFRSIGGIDACVAHWALTAVATAVVALMFLLEVSFARWWPVFVILGGFYAMLPDRGRRRRDRNAIG